MALLWLLPLLMLGALAITGGVRRYALARSMIDLPNHRSSHSIPTPRGGGVSIVLVYLASLPLMGSYGALDWPMAMGLMGAGALVAVVGFLDDNGGFPVRWRLLAHFLAAGWLLAWLPALPSVVFLGYTLDLGWLGYGLATVFLVWLLNLYNFMDGIDGIASVQALTTCIGGALLYVLIGERVLAITPLLLAAAVLGFLYWNLPSARIFLGDSGSGFLGIVLGGLAMQAAWVEPQLLWAWLILLGVFVVDTTYTLVRRLIRGDRITEAHRMHAYQYASRQYDSHLKVTVGIGLLNVLWLLPMACLVAIGSLDGFLALLIAYLPLVALAVYFKAGQLETAP